MPTLAADVELNSKHLSRSLQDVRHRPQTRGLLVANLIKMSAREKPLMPRRPLVSGHVEIFLHHHSLATMIHFLPFYLKEKRSSALRLQRRDNDSNTLRSLPNAFSWFWTKIRGKRKIKTRLCCVQAAAALLITES